MGKPLSNDEKRRIITLFEDGNEIAEIKKITGRSREAISKVLTDVGLLESEVIGQAWHRARASNSNFRLLSISQRETIVKKCIKQIQEEAKCRYSILFSTVSDKKDTDKSDDTIKISDIMNYCAKSIEFINEQIVANAENMKNCKNQSDLVEYIRIDSRLRSRLTLYTCDIPNTINEIKKGK